MDMLAQGIGEIIGASQREERLDVLDRNMAERGIDLEHYAWYRDLRRYGTVPHSRLRPRLRAHPRLRHRPRQRPRRRSLPANPRKRAVLMRRPTDRVGRDLVRELQPFLAAEDAAKPTAAERASDDERSG